MNSKKAVNRSRRSKDIALLYSLGLVDCYRKVNSKKVLSYSAALRQLAVGPGGNPAAAVCELCGEVVSRRKGFMERRFGILENCNHVFCLGCIREYRQLEFVQKQSEEDGRSSCCEAPLPPPVSCPVCGSASGVVASSETWISGQDAKRTHLLLFREEMSSMACPWVQSGQGQCMFPGRCVTRQG